MNVRSSSSRMPTRFVSKPGTIRSLPMTSGKRSAAAPSTGCAVSLADEADDREVAVLGAAILDRHERRLLVAQLLDDLVDLRVGDLVDLGRERDSSRSRRASPPDGRARAPSRRPRRPPRSATTRARPGSGGRRRPTRAARRGPSARRGARGPRRRSGSGRPGRRDGRRARARASGGAPCRAGSPARACGAPRWRTPSSMAAWSWRWSISTSSTIVLSSPFRMVVVTVSLFVGDAPGGFAEYREARGRTPPCPRPVALAGARCPWPDAGVGGWPAAGAAVFPPVAHAPQRTVGRGVVPVPVVTGRATGTVLRLAGTSLRQAVRCAGCTNTPRRRIRALPPHRGRRSRPSVHSMRAEVVERQTRQL